MAGSILHPMRRSVAITLVALGGGVVTTAVFMANDVVDPVASGVSRFASGVDPDNWNRAKNVVQGVNAGRKVMSSVGSGSGGESGGAARGGFGGTGAAAAAGS